MKVLHTIEGLSRAAGGPTSCTYNLLCGLRENHIDAELLANTSPDNIADDSWLHFVDDDRHTPLHISTAFGNWLSENARRFDVIHANGLWTWHTHLATKAARKVGKPLVIAPHGMLYPQGLASKPWKKQLALTLYQRRDLNRADLLQATCEAEAQFIRQAGFDRPIAIVPNSVPVNKLPKPRTDENEIRRIGFVGRIHPIKNIDRLIEAWRRLGHHTRGCLLELIGGGSHDYMITLQNQAAEIDNINFRGFMGGDELYNAINQLDYLVLPSKSENFGMVVAESLALNIPAIVSTGAPWGELHDNQCGWWIEPTVDNLAETILAAIHQSETDRRLMGQRGRQLVIQKYSTDAVARSMSDAYSSLL